MVTYAYEKLVKKTSRNSDEKENKKKLGWQLRNAITKSEKY